MKANDMTSRQNEIYNAIIGTDIEQGDNILVDQYGYYYVDEGIDDGGDASGTYVMQRTYTSKSGEYIQIYWLDTDQIITYVEF